MKNVVSSAIVAFIMTIIFANQAYAYLDPGTGSYIIQVVLAAFVGAAFSIKLFWNKIKTSVKKVFGKDERI